MPIIISTAFIVTAAIIIGVPSFIGTSISIIGCIAGDAIDRQIEKIKINKQIKKILIKMDVKFFKLNKNDELLNKICIFCPNSYQVGDKCCTLKCGHTYHKKCLEEWAVIAEKCIICNK